MLDRRVTGGDDSRFKVVLLQAGFCENDRCQHRSDRPELALKIKGKVLCKYCGIKVLVRLANQVEEAKDRLKEAIDNEPLPNQLRLFE